MPQVPRISNVQINVNKQSKKYIKLSKYNKNMNEMGESFFSNNNNADKDGIVEYTNHLMKNQYSSDSFQ